LVSKSLNTISLIFHILQKHNSMYQRLQNYLKQTTLVLGLLVASSSFLQAQNWDKVIKAVAGDRENRNSTSRAADDRYGNAVAISGDYAVVGAPGEKENENGIDQYSNPGAVAGGGAVYILQNISGTWKTIKKVCSPERGAGYNFGKSVSISYDKIVVGAPGEELAAGAAYVFEKNKGA
jgi:hypothetical protein